MLLLAGTRGEGEGARALLVSKFWLEDGGGGGEFDGPQRTWGGAFDHNTRSVGNLIRCLDSMFRAALRI